MPKKLHGWRIGISV
jgi:hypothetical protein